MCKNLFLLLLLLTSVSCVTTDKAAKDQSSSLPHSVSDLIMPAGFDNAFAIRIINKEPVKYVKPLIRIMPFEVPASFKKAIRDEQFKMDAFLKSEIAKTGRYQLLGSTDDINAAIEEQRKSSNDFFVEDSGVEIGGLLVAGFVLTGGVSQSYPIVTRVGGHFSLKVSVGVSISVVDVNTGKIAYTNNINVENEEILNVTSEGMIIRGPTNLTNRPINAIGATGADIDLGPQYRMALEEATKKTIRYLEEKHPIMGEILAVNNKEIISTASEENGIKAGDYIFIVRAGSPLVDSSGRLLGLSKTMIGAAQVTSVENNMSTAKIVKLKDQDAGASVHDIIISLPATAD